MDENSDLFRLWAVQNIFETQIMDDVLGRIATQTENIKQAIKNAVASQCINSQIASLKQVHPLHFFCVFLPLFLKKSSLHSIVLKSSCLFCMNFEIDHAKKGRGC